MKNTLTGELPEVELSEGENHPEDRSSQAAEKQEVKITSGPNPAGDIYEIRFDRSIEEPLMIQVSAINGQIVYTGRASIGDTQAELKTAGWPLGVNFIRVSNLATGELIYTAKVVKH